GSDRGAVVGRDPFQPRPTHGSYRFVDCAGPARDCLYRRAAAKPAKTGCPIAGDSQPARLGHIRGHTASPNGASTFKSVTTRPRWARDQNLNDPRSFRAKENQ